MISSLSSEGKVDKERNQPYYTILEQVIPSKYIIINTNYLYNVHDQFLIV